MAESTRKLTSVFFAPSRHRDLRLKAEEIVLN